ncbi:9494_t:CDS:2 [Funneliformis geosporum]|uniref:3641_t:CDS:1 n=1 Tax=Funneliformis geosporum TaxID=1117311 RepID=A0A9W4SYZ8_9GLOM|nr:9494_t:CDS:2 [Funneliformis geosporum]CAI2185846.1 3641_t:CDS:2 [Funneliformis geosporum]
MAPIDNPLFPRNNTNPRILSQSQSKSIPSEDPKDCTFCKIISGQLSCVKVFENEEVLAFLAPISKGHTLVVPKTHIPRLTLAPPSIMSSLGSVLPRISNAVIQGVGAKDFNLLQNNGSIAGQVVFHLHFHIIPRFKNDERWGDRDVGRLRISKDASENIGKEIRAKL